MSTNARRLAQAVRKRREQLDLSQIDVWQAGGPSNTTLTEIENARLEKLTPVTARRLDIGMRWERGSARLVWEDGGDPIPIQPVRDDPRDRLRRQILEADYLTAEEKHHLLSALATPSASGGEGHAGPAAM